MHTLPTSGGTSGYLRSVTVLASGGARAVGAPTKSSGNTEYPAYGRWTLGVIGSASVANPTIVKYNRFEYDINDSYLLLPMRPILIPQGPFRYPLSSAFRTEANVRVLRELARHGGPLDTGRLIRATHLTRQTVLTVLHHLTGLQLVLAVGTGRYRSFQVNAGHPLLPALTHLFEAEAARVDRVYEGVRDAASTAGPDVRAVWLYGSVARGDDTPASDLDLAIVVSAPEPIDSIIQAFRDHLSPVERAECVTVSVVGVSDHDVRRLSAGDPWWVTVERDAVPLVGDAPADYARRAHRLAGGGGVADERTPHGVSGRPA